MQSLNKDKLVDGVPTLKAPLEMWKLYEW
jgi:hypothetical protein